MSATRNERTMTVQDWKALYLVHRLMEQIVLHGASQLDVFVDAIHEARHSTSAEVSR